MKAILWIVANWSTVVFLLALLISIIQYIRVNGKNIIKSLGPDILTACEKELGGGTGVLKISKAVGLIYDKLPAMVKLVLPQSAVESLLEELLPKVKTLWGTNAALAKLTGTTLWTYNITYDGNGSEGGTVPIDSTSYMTGTAAAVFGNVNTLTRTGYIFVGWNTAADGSGTAVASGAVLTISTENVTLYAVWAAAQVAT